MDKWNPGDKVGYKHSGGGISQCEIVSLNAYHENGVDCMLTLKVLKPGLPKLKIGEEIHSAYDKNLVYERFGMA